MTDDADDFGDDVAGAFDDDTVSGGDAEAGDFIFVVKGGTADDDAADGDGAEVGDGGEGASAADLDVDFLDDGFGLAGGVFEGDGPAWELGGPAEFLLLGDGIDFGDDAIDFEGEGFALGGVALAEGDEFIDVCAELAGGIDLEAHGGEFVEGLPMGRAGGAAVGEEEVGVEVELAVGGDGRVEDAEGAGGGVAGVGVAGKAFLLAVGVEFLEGGVRHDDFAAGFELGSVAADFEGKAADGAGVGGDVFSFGAVAAGEGELERAVGILGSEGEAVELEFGDVLEGLVAEEVADSLVEGAEFGFVEGVIQAEHGRGVAEFDEAFAWSSADALGGGVRGDERRVGVFEGLEFAHEGVVFGIRKLGLIEDVIEVLVVADLVDKLFNFAHEGHPIGYLWSCLRSPLFLTLARVSCCGTHG